MTIEDEIFTKSKIDTNKIIEYGFKKENNSYTYSKNIMNNTFKIDIKIKNNNHVTGKIYDLSTEDEYTNFRIEDLIGSFAKQVRKIFIDTLKDIKNKCFISELFTPEQSNRIAKQIKLKYHSNPEFKWNKFPGYAVFKNPLNKKWYGIIMNIDKSKIEANSTGEIEIIDIKLEPNKIENLLNKNGFYPAYHMNKKNWVTIILDDTIPDKDIMNLINESYSYTITKKNNNK